MFYVGKMPKNPAISKATRNAILDAAWTLTVERQSLDLTQAEICRAAGVTRQTVYLAFGGLPGILDAMLDRQDEGSAELREMIALRERERPETEDFWRYIRLWLAYLPRIYPVAILLDAAARTDPSAARAYRTRMPDRFRAGLRGFWTRLPEAADCARGWIRRWPRTSSGRRSIRQAGGCWSRSADGPRRNSARARKP